ncbi:MAG: NADP-dependent isocitrate dehydrogenase, partial [Campylobacteraceae bacterium]|nr:NADP-dependent isocitrate dehydrogenase [Campylobacteraceae bacterium]
TTAGSVSNIGLMAKKAEEYGSHDKTFIMENDGEVVVKDENNKTIFTFKVENGDIFRVCQTKDVAVKDWVKLAYNRAKTSKQLAIFWLDDNRPHDMELKKKVDIYLKDYDLSLVDISILNPKEATEFSLKRMREGKDTISVTGNVARDYLTDLFPIMELGTSAKMLSIVPLMNGGGLFETGAGGSAPAIVQRMLKSNRLTWDSFGEYMAVFASLEFIAQKTGDKNIELLAKTLDKAIENILINDKNPKRDVGELDTRGGHFYLAYYWAQELSLQKENGKIAKIFEPIFDEFKKQEKEIVKEFNSIQGTAIVLDGYFNPSDEFLNKLMKPSVTFNKILENIK